MCTSFIWRKYCCCCFFSDTTRTLQQPCFPLTHTTHIEVGLRTTCICFERPVQHAHKPQPQKAVKPGSSATWEGRQNNGLATNSENPRRSAAKRVYSKQPVCHHVVIQSSMTSKASEVFSVMFLLVYTRECDAPTFQECSKNKANAIKKVL